MITRSILQFPTRGALVRGLLVVGVLLISLVAPTVYAQSAPDFWGTGNSQTDSLGHDFDSYWGPLPARGDSVSAVFRERPRPTWETAAMVPYWVVGLPFRAAWYATDQSVKGMDKLGFFGGQAEYPGLVVPGGAFVMPTIVFDGLEGLTLGVHVTKPHFLGRDNMLFLRGARSNSKSGAYGGGTLFHLTDAWHLETGGGFESRNQARYYGLGPDSRNGNLSYYYRSVSWGGLALERDLRSDLQLGTRIYFSQVQSRQPHINRDEALELVHPADLPPGYPGQSNGWTVRLGLDRNNTNQEGRPRRGGYQAVGVSLFRATDGSDLSYLTWHANLEKYFKLWHTDRTLAVRGFANRLTKASDEPIPFSRLVTFQRPDELRGFHSLRFYGMGSLGLSLEYRWPLWVARDRDDLGLDGYLFSDSGQVFNHTDEISLTNFHWTAGGGMRVISTSRRMAMRFEVGLSDESTVLRLTFSQTFQYNPKGFLYGKNPTKIY